MYRYTLERNWEEGSGMVNFIGLNPSTATDTEDDPTIRRCTSIAKNLGFEGFYMTNLFAARSTDSKNLLNIADPIGKTNNELLLQYAFKSDLVIAMWGNYGTYLNRDRLVKHLVPNLHYFKLTKEHNPHHVLYLSHSETKTVKCLV